MKNKAAWAFILLVSIPYVVFSVPQLMGLDAYIVSSGSMAPEMPKGSIIFSYNSPEENLQRGDVIVFEPNRSRMDADLVTHRIIEVEEGNYTTYYRTKGDANPNPYPGRIPAYDVMGKRAFSVPYIGYIITATNNPLVLLILLTIPAIILIQSEINKISEATQNNKEEQENSARKTVRAQENKIDRRNNVKVGSIQRNPGKEKQNSKDSSKGSFLFED